MGLVHHLSPLEYKAIGLLEFKVESPLHIGTGATDARRALIRIPGGRGLLIPSSTWKGAFRSVSERIARNMDFGNGLANLAVRSFREEPRAAYEVDRKFCEEVLNVLRGGKSSTLPYSSRDLVEAAGEVGFTREEIDEVKNRGFDARDNLLSRLAESILAIHCPIGKLYGNRVLAGKLRFFDTVLEQRAGMVHEKPGVAIDRRSGRVKEALLFTLESIAGGEARLRIIADNLMPGAEDSRLFALTLEAIEALGLSLGARKSAGMGSLKMSTETSHWYVIDLKEDRGGAKIGNPFKYAERKSLKEFLEWLVAGAL